MHLWANLKHISNYFLQQKYSGKRDGPFFNLPQGNSTKKKKKKNSKGGKKNLSDKNFYSLLASYVKSHITAIKIIIIKHIAFSRANLKYKILSTTKIFGQEGWPTLQLATGKTQH